MIRLPLLLAGILFLGTAAFAQGEPSEAVLSQYHRAATRTVNAVLPNLRSVLRSSERRMLDDIDIGVNRRDWNVYGVYASKRGSDRSIRFSMGFVIAVDYLDVAVAASEMLGVPGTKMIDYVHLVTESVRESAQRARRGESPVGIPSFGEWLGMPKRDWDQLVRSKQFVNYREIVKLHSFALILGHELAHHFEGHLDDASSSVYDEIEADERGIEIATQADYNTLLSWTPFIFFAAMEGDQGIFDASASHPPPVCRMVRVLEVGVDDALDDRGFVNYLEETGRYYAWMANVEALAEFVNSGQIRCP